MTKEKELNHNRSKEDTPPPAITICVARYTGCSFPVKLPGEGARTQTRRQQNYFGTLSINSLLRG